MPIRFRAKRLLGTLCALACACVLGCSPKAETTEELDLSKTVPVKGKVTINGKPYAGVVVTFLPAKWVAGNGETGADGSYSLETGGRPGVLPGEYKVAVSYLLSTEGKPQGLSVRSSMAPVPSLASAKEKVLPEFSDLGRTTLKATVTAAGGTFDFDVKGDLDAPPAADAKPAEPKKAEAPAKDAKK